MVRALVPAMVPGVGGSNPLLGSKRSDALSYSISLLLSFSFFDTSERRGIGSVAQNRESAPFGEVDGRLHPLPATVANRKARVQTVDAV